MSLHPVGVQPSWQKCQEDYKGPDVRGEGLGLLALFDDEVLIELLHLLGAKDLAALACGSRACFAFCQHEDLWKALLLQGDVAEFDWRGSWQRSYIATHHPQHQLPAHDASKPAQAHGLFSDLLYQPWLCARVEVAPEWIEVDNIDRRSGLTVEQFRAEYELPNRPVVLTDVVPRWPAFRKWSNQYLRAAWAAGAAARGGSEAACAKPHVVVGNAPMCLDAFLAYQADNSDELPLYLFDRTFCSSAPQLQRDYSVPDYFAEDLFAVLGDARPDHRWLIMGPQRSGSSFHVDPNATSAWNALVRGRKKWLLYPPHAVPPGVHPSPDGADVATPLSIIEWFLNFYDCTRQGAVRPVECVVEAGELIFVPRGWWHLALNLEESLAITHNYVSGANLPHVLSFLDSRSSDLVSGCAHGERSSLHDRFVAALQAQRPEVLAMAEEQRAAKRRRLDQQRQLSQLFKAPQEGCGGKAGEGVAGGRTSGTGSTAPVHGSSSGFTFGFSFSSS